MKKSLLLGLAVTCAGVAMAETAATPTLYPNASFQRISADGRYIVSEVYGSITIYDLKEGTSTQYTESENDNLSYSLGLGNCMNADGSILLASNSPEFNATYLENGRWYELPVPFKENSNFANGVTPDGARICGSVGMSAFGVENSLMLAPAYWDRNADNTGYGECHLLPHPVIDLFDEKPQYVTAVAISDDGKTIVGQMTFGSGMMNIPVLYVQAADGQWSYSLPTRHLFNPDNIAPVADPGDGPICPSYEDYMTEAEINAYNQAVNDYYLAGDWEAPYPSFEDYMTSENLAAYNKACEEYNEANNEWTEKWLAFNDYRDAVIAASPNFVFNNVIITPDGTKCVGSLEAEDPNADPWSWFSRMIYTPCVVDLATGDITKMPIETTCLASGIADNGNIILGYNTQSSTPMIGYVFKDGTCRTIQDYISEINPDYGTWINDNLTHTVFTGLDPETFEDIYETYTFTGMPIATPDMKVIAFWNTAPWDDSIFAEGAVFDMDANNGVAAIKVDAEGLAIDAEGNVNVPAGFSSIEVYSLSGARIKTITAPVGSVNLGVTAGAYIVKGTRTNGNPSIIKIAK